MFELPAASEYLKRKELEETVESAPSESMQKGVF